MCECPCVLRPFFGQCIFNIIFAASAYPSQLPSPISLPPLPSSLSCRGRNFFGFFIFWLLFIHPPHPHPPRPLAATLFAMGVYVFFPHTTWQSPGGWSPPIGNCPVCRWPRCICEMLSTLLYLYLPLPTPPPLPNLFLYSFFLLHSSWVWRLSGHWAGGGKWE